jgi:hypothetical protein
MIEIPEAVAELGSAGSLSAGSLSNVVGGEKPTTPDPTLIQPLASNAVLVEEHMQFAVPFISIFSLGLWGYL